MPFPEKKAYFIISHLKVTRVQVYIGENLAGVNDDILASCLSWWTVVWVVAVNAARFTAQKNLPFVAENRNPTTKKRQTTNSDMLHLADVKSQ